MMQRECYWCGEPLVYRPGEGWVHQGGSAMMMLCGRCGLHAAALPTPAGCTACGDTERWREDHNALPRTYSGERPAVRPVPLRGQGVGE